MASFVKFNVFVKDLADGVHDLQASGDTIRAYLTNATPAATNTLKANIAEISGGNGYTSGGNDIQNDTALSTATAAMTGVDYTVTASGSVGPFRYVILYNDTTTAKTDPLIGYWDYGSSITLAAGETFSVDFGAFVLTLV